MQNQLHEGALNHACREVASAILWSPHGTSSDLVETLAARFQEIAERHDEFIMGQDRDPNVITRAVRYLAKTVLPVTTDATLRFDSSLNALIELAVPNSCVDKSAAQFFEDVREGMAIADQNVKLRAD